MRRREFNKKALLFAMGMGFAASGCNEKMKKASKTSRKRPNILFCLADDASYPHMGAYGCDWVKTPGFDYVAENGILFYNAYTPNAKCAPSRACILTGRNSWQLEEACNHMPVFPVKFKTYPEVLQEEGYHVGYCGKGWAPGVAKHADGSKRHLCGKPYQKKKLTPPATGINDLDYTANFRAFLRDRDESQPFCFWYGSTEPHRAYEYGCGINKGNKELSDIEEVYDFWPEDKKIKTDLLDYAYEIEYFDSHLKKMLKILERKGELDNTIVVVSGDNGMPFPRIKGQAYDLSNHLPLAIMWKDGIKAPGRKIDDFVNFIDFAPTFLDLANIDQNETGMHPIEGRSLTDILFSSKSGNVNPKRDHVLIGKERHDIGRPHDRGYPIRGIVKGDYLYIKNFKPDRWPACNPETGYLNCDGSPTKTVCLDARETEKGFKYWKWNFGKRPQEELYNIKKDRQCMNNLAEDLQYNSLRKELKEQLFAELKEQGDPRMFGNGHIFDDYKLGWDQYNNYYERFMKGDKTPTPWVNKSDFRPIE